MQRNFFFLEANRIALAGALAALSVSAMAQTPTTPSKPGELSAAGDTAVQHQNGIAYVTGGVGQASQAHTKALGSEMSLALVFATADGNYIAGADVKIDDAGGRKVLSLDSAGPLLFVQLQPGSYKVSATARDKTVERNVNVPNKGQHTEHMVW